LRIVLDKFTGGDKAMRRNLIILITFTLSIVLCSCGSSDKSYQDVSVKSYQETSAQSYQDTSVQYYQNTSIKKLETFTSLTGVEVNIQNDLDTGILYSYIVDADATGVGAVTKYLNYLTQNGFVKNENYSGAGEVYYKDSDFLMISRLETGNVIQFTIVLPKTGTDSTVGQSKAETKSEYEQLVQYCVDGDYTAAQKLYDSSSTIKNSENKDSAKKYYLYAEGMDYYNNGVYGTAYKLLSQYATGLLKADETLANIEKKLGSLDGVYENQSVGYSGMYMIIKNGRVELDTYSSFGSKSISDPVYYLDSLIDYTFTTGKSTYAISNGNINKNDVQYIMATINGDSITLAAPAGSTYTTYSGVYKKTEYPAPSAK
jgi:hypothetical protein